jgi:hypothetical protein
MGNDLCFETLSLCKRSYCVRNSLKPTFLDLIIISDFVESSIILTLWRVKFTLSYLYCTGLAMGEEYGRVFQKKGFLVKLLLNG